jgi:hypothetical protein
MKAAKRVKKKSMGKKVVKRVKKKSVGKKK